MVILVIIPLDVSQHIFEKNTPPNDLAERSTTGAKKSQYQTAPWLKEGSCLPNQVFHAPDFTRMSPYFDTTLLWSPWKSTGTTPPKCIQMLPPPNKEGLRKGSLTTIMTQFSNEFRVSSHWTACNPCFLPNSAFKKHRDVKIGKINQTICLQLLGKDFPHWFCYIFLGWSFWDHLVRPWGPQGPRASNNQPHPIAQLFRPVKLVMKGFVDISFWDIRIHQYS